MGLRLLGARRVPDLGVGLGLGFRVSVRGSTLPRRRSNTRAFRCKGPNGLAGVHAMFVMVAGLASKQLRHLQGSGSSWTDVVRKMDNLSFQGILPWSLHMAFVVGVSISWVFCMVPVKA